jgi:hypothetical protein
MRLSALPIINFNGINSFCTGNQWIIRSGDPNTLYFQLIDLDQNCGCGCPQRYVAAAGSTMIVTFPSIDCSSIIQITATQNAQDGSVWSIPIVPAQRPSGGAVKFSLTSGSDTWNFSVINMLCVQPLNGGSDGALADYGTYSYYPGEDSGV